MTITIYQVDAFTDRPFLGKLTCVAVTVLKGELFT